MNNPQRISALAIASMLWSVFVGAGALLVLRLLQVVAGSGQAGPFPVEVLDFYIGVEILLSLVLWGVLQRLRQTRMVLWVLLVLIVATTVLVVRPAGGWVADFLPIALCLEAVWLAPWLLTACVL
jgi:hypothetical protein